MATDRMACGGPADVQVAPAQVRIIFNFLSIFPALVPEPIENLVRRVIDDRRALNRIDAEGRRAYIDRIDRLSRDHSAGEPTIAVPAKPESREGRTR